MPNRKSPSPKQLAANRANAAHSTGPTTPEGKARSAQNARKHGFTASTFAVVRIEDLQEIAQLRSDLIAVYQPVNAQELFAIERMALAQQGLLRTARLEGGMLTNCVNECLDGEGIPFIPMSRELTGGPIEVTRDQNRNYGLADGFTRMAKQSNSWSLFLRYQAQAERLYRRAVEEFERLKRLRTELPNEPIIEDQVDKTEVDPAPETNPVVAPFTPEPSTDTVQPIPYAPAAAQSSAFQVSWYSHATPDRVVSRRCLAPRVHTETAPRIHVRAASQLPPMPLRHRRQLSARSHGALALPTHRR